MGKNTHRSHCPINFAVERFGDRWTLLIIRDIVFQGKTSYSDFLSSVEKISTNILADRLSMLEREGLITKLRDEQHRSKYIYKPTTKMLDLLPILVEMIVWSVKYDPETPLDQEYVDRIINDRSGFIESILSKHKDELMETSL